MEILEEINKNQKIFINSMKTIEEAAQEYADNCCSRKGEQIILKDSDVNEYIKDAFNECAGVMQRFIPVEEELPKPNTDFPFTKYLVQVNIFAKNYSCQTCTVAHYECGKWYTDRDDEDIIEITVTHWRPINFK